MTLAGVKVVHIASLGPGPFAAMLLADLGADVVVLDRVDDSLQGSAAHDRDVRRRGQRSLRVDLKQGDAAVVLEALIARADVLIEGMRPGAAERLGLGPHRCAELNPRLIYGRMTGWGQDGPMARRAGHDINYIGLTGALEAMGRPGEPPPPPLNLLGDYAGGGVYLALAILAALLERETSGAGEVIDAAIIDGVASLTAPVFGMIASGRWSARGSNVFDGSAPFYRTFETRDHRYVAVGAIEPAFYEQLMAGVGLDPAAWPQHDRSRWPELAGELESIFRTRDRDDWAERFGATDACVTPVLSFEEAPNHPHHLARGTYAGDRGETQPAPVPRFAGRPRPLSGPPPAAGADTNALLRELGFSAADVRRLRATRAVA